MVISRKSPDVGILNPINPQSQWKLDEIGFVEANLMLDSDIQASEGGVVVGMNGFVDNSGWWLACGIGGSKNGNASAGCYATDYSISGYHPVEYDSWHKLRFEVNANTATISFFLDDQKIGTYTHPNPEMFNNAQFLLELQAVSKDGNLVTGYVDDVRIGQLGQ